MAHDCPPILPRSVDIEVTTRCNLGCRYCYLGKPGADDMTPETANLVIGYLDRLAAAHGGWRTLEVNLYGGEPFLNFPIVQMFARAAQAADRSRRQCVTIFTNGATATPEQVAWCLSHGITPNRSTAGCPEAAELTRPGGYTERWLAEGVLWGDQHASRRLTVIPETAELVCKSVKWLHEHGYHGTLDIATDDYAWCPASASKTYECSMMRLAAEFVRQYKRGHHLGIECFTNVARSLFEYPDRVVLGCGAGSSTCGITHDGTVVPCHRCFREPNESPLHGHNIRLMRQALVPTYGREVRETIGGWANGIERGECRECPARQACSRGCMHSSYAVCGKLDASPLIRCQFMRLYVRLARWINEQLNGKWWDTRLPQTCYPFHYGSESRMSTGV